MWVGGLMRLFTDSAHNATRRGGESAGAVRARSRAGRCALTAIFLAAATMTWAQRTPSVTGFGRLSNPGAVSGVTGGGGFGRVIYPGTGAPAARRTNIPGAPVIAAPPVINHGAHGVAVAVPYPVFYGGSYYDYEAPPAPVANQPSDYYNYPQDPNQQPPVVIINQYFRPDTANPVLRDYSNAQLPAPAAVQQPAPASDNTGAEPVMFLIAMKDSTIYPAVAYWVEKDTINYITPQGVKNTASLDAVDLDFSKKLNKDRKIDFGLPAAK